MKLNTALKLARASNLPTVWSNVLVGAALCGQGTSWSGIFWVALSISAIYCGGMFLNDVMDVDWDRSHRNERPIPQGEATLSEAFNWATGLMVAGLLGCIAVAWTTPGQTLLTNALDLATGPQLSRVWFTGGLLLASIAIYNRWHHDNPFAWSIMGLCRGFVYLLAACSLGPSLENGALIACIALWSYVGGLTHVAKFEAPSFQKNSATETNNAPDGTPSGMGARTALWLPWLIYLPLIIKVGPSITWLIPLSGACWVASTLYAVRRQTLSVGGCVGRLIAGMPFVDAMILLSLGQISWAFIALAMVGLCSGWQRSIAGT